MELIKIKRKNKAIGLIGTWSKGKTLFKVWYCYLLFRFEGYIVFSNIPLKFPHILIESIEDIKKIRTDYNPDDKKIFLADDFEFWFSNRSYASKTNKSLNEILIFFGKINCDIIYSSKRGNVDIGLVLVTNEFYHLEMYNYIFPPIEIISNPEDYLNFCCIELRGVHSDGKEIPPKYLINLDKICRLYDTQHTIDHLIISD